MQITLTNPFKGRHYPGEVIVRCVRWLSFAKNPSAGTHYAKNPSAGTHYAAVRS